MTYTDIPDGYFDTLPSRVMKRIHEEEARGAKSIDMHTWHRWAIAASLTGVIALAGVVATYRFNNTTAQRQVVSESIQSSYTEDAIDYAMIDNQEIESFLAEE